MLAAAAADRLLFGAVRRAVALVSSQEIAPPSCRCSHGLEDPARQAVVMRSVLEQVRSGADAIVGLMLESNLRAGSQPSPAAQASNRVRGEKPAHGVSITDACIGWEETEALLYEAARAVARGRRGAARVAVHPVMGAPA